MTAWIHCWITSSSPLAHSCSLFFSFLSLLITHQTKPHPQNLSSHSGTTLKIKTSYSSKMKTYSKPTTHPHFNTPNPPHTLKFFNNCPTNTHPLHLYSSLVQARKWSRFVRHNSLCRAKIPCCAMPESTLTCIGFPTVTWQWSCRAENPYYAMLESAIPWVGFPAVMWP